MGTSRLQLYNKALTFVGARTLASLTEERESRRVLDTIWDAGAVQHCLEQGYWNFAMRTVRLDSTSELEPDFGYKDVFIKPSDWVRTFSVSADEYVRYPLNDYVDEAGHIFTDVDPIYMQYVSDGTEYGLSYGDWPESFTRYVELYLAFNIAPRLTSGLSTANSFGEVDKLDRAMKRALIDARTQDASNESTKFAPLGSWAGSRLGGRGSYRRNKGNGLG